MTIFVIVGVVIINSFLHRILYNFPRAELGGAVFADVTSANVVGYAGKELNQTGGTMAGAMFQTVGNANAEITFGDLIPLLESGAKATAGRVNLQYLAPGGGTDTSHRYAWMGTYWRNLSTGKDAKDEFVPAGQGMWVANNTGTKLAFHSSGEVSEKDILFHLNQTGGTGVANTFPIDITMGRLIPQTPTGTKAAAGRVNAQYLAPGGGTDTTHRYAWMGTYWRNLSTGKDASNETFPAGQGIWVANNTGAALDIYVAAPEY